MRQGRFNPDDYRSIRPNSFMGLKGKYLARKRGLVSFGKTEHAINMASSHFSLTNVREINGADTSRTTFSASPISPRRRGITIVHISTFGKGVWQGAISSPWLRCQHSLRLDIPSDTVKSPHGKYRPVFLIS